MRCIGKVAPVSAPKEKERGGGVGGDSASLDACALHRDPLCQVGLCG